MSNTIGNRDVIAIGTSAGGVEALMAIARGLPPAFPATVLVTLHIGSYQRSSLDDLLSGVGKLPATFATHGEPLRKSHIYIAPPDRHLILDGETLTLGSGPRENSSRPAIDPMLRAVALCCGARAIGVVLTGTLGDGAAGLWAINRCGGVSVVQDPADAAFPEMPANALAVSRPHHVVRLGDIPALLTTLVQQPASTPRATPVGLEHEVAMPRTGRGSMAQFDKIAGRAVFACPDCGGVMWEIDEGDLVLFRCYAGHTFTAELPGLALDESLRQALASAQHAGAGRAGKKAAAAGGRNRQQTHPAAELDPECRGEREGPPRHP